VKLDISLVRDVNVDLGRQALVVGMRHFAAEAGCELLAEGIETQLEADTLLALGVDLGQGYLFGYPEQAEAWSAETAGEIAGTQASKPDGVDTCRTIEPHTTVGRPLADRRAGKVCGGWQRPRQA
jgi:predicted signal transduction protein with EAL and GGDEF domain